MTDWKHERHGGGSPSGGVNPTDHASVLEELSQHLDDRYDR